MRGEQRYLHNDAALARLGEKIVETLKIFRAPMVQVELISTARISRSLAACPRRHEFSAGGGEIVALNAERLSGDFDVLAPENAREVQSVAFEGIQVTAIVEIGVDYRAVVLAAGDQSNGLSTKQKVMRIFRMKPDWLGWFDRRIETSEHDNTKGGTKRTDERVWLFSIHAGVRCAPVGAPIL